METLAERLKALRSDRRLTQEALWPRLSRYRVPRSADFRLVCRLANFLEVSTDYLLDWSDDPSPRVAVDDLMTTARRLKAIRDSRSMSQQELADRLGIAAPDLSRYESALDKPPDDLIDRLAEVFEVDRRYFTGEIDRAEIERLLGETWFRAPADLSPEAKKTVEDFIAFVIAQEERRRQQEKRQGQQK